MKIPPSFQAVIEALQILPGVGKKSAQRMVIGLLKKGPTAMTKLGDALLDAATKITLCETCGNFADSALCSICADESRDGRLIMVVAEPSNIMTVERSGSYKGRYHVLGGLISPLKGVSPDQLNIKQLTVRLKKNPVDEVIIATNPTSDGEATAVWLSRHLAEFKITTSRIGLGLPFGSDLEYADELTLDQSILSRKKI